MNPTFKSETVPNMEISVFSLRSHYYEPFSFVRDPEMVDAVKQLLAGLSELTFSMYATPS